jgi:hypothetical protein
VREHKEEEINGKEQGQTVVKKGRWTIEGSE